VEVNHQVFSSESSLGGITCPKRPDERFPSSSRWIRRATTRSAARSARSSRRPTWRLMEGTIRSGPRILDSLPIGEEFDWVKSVSIELTTQMLATLFDFPFEDRHLLTWWSDMSPPGTPAARVRSTSREARRRTAEVPEVLHPAVERARQRAAAHRPDLDAGAFAGHPRHDAEEFLGNLVLLIVGGNDTTRNSISGGLLALNQFPDQYAKLRENPRWSPAWCPRSSAGRRRWRTCAAPRWRHRARRQADPQGATRW
jgi:cytochrome P450